MPTPRPPAIGHQRRTVGRARARGGAHHGASSPIRSASRPKARADAEPVAPNDTDANRAKNRRVAIQLRPCAMTTILDQLAAQASGADASTSARVAQELETIRARFKQAAEDLDGARFASPDGKGREVEELPWYVMIGAPGSGKTTALLNSGPALPAVHRQRHRALGPRRRRHAQLRLVVHRRGGAARHRGPLHHAGKRPQGRRRGLARLSRAAEAVPPGAPAQRRAGHGQRDGPAALDQGRARQVRGPRAHAPVGNVRGAGTRAFRSTCWSPRSTCWRASPNSSATGRRRRARRSGAPPSRWTSTPR